MSTLISVGNAKQPFNRLIDSALAHINELPKPIFVQHGHSPFVGNGVEAFAFANMDDFGRLLRDSRLLIMHAGAGSIIHALNEGKRPIIMARQMMFGEHVDNHQVEFCEALDAAGRAISVTSVTDFPSAIAGALAGADQSVTPRSEPRLARAVAECLESHRRKGA